MHAHASVLSSIIKEYGSSPVSFSSFRWISETITCLMRAEHLVRCSRISFWAISQTSSPEWSPKCQNAWMASKVCCRKAAICCILHCTENEGRIWRQHLNWDGLRRAAETQSALKCGLRRLKPLNWVAAIEQKFKCHSIYFCNGQ